MLTEMLFICKVKFTNYVNFPKNWQFSKKICFGY